MKINFNKQVKYVEHVFTKNSPMILTGLGVIGVAFTGVLTWQAATEAERTIADAAAKHNLSREGADEYKTTKSFSKKERFELTWKLYIAPVCSAVLTCGAIVGAQTINARRAAAIAGVLALTQDDLKGYKEKVKEKLTGPQYKKVNDEIAQEKANDMWEKHDMLIVGEGNILCVEKYTMRQFESSRNKIERAVNDLNRRIFENEAAKLSEFYDMLKLKHTAISDEMGWNINAPLELDFTAIITPDGKPALMFDYVDQPWLNPEEGPFRDRT